MCIKKKLLSLCAAAGLVLLPAAAAAQTWTSSNGKEREAETINGYDYELWNQNGAGTATMVINGDNGQGANAKGGTFTAQWSGTCNVLFRSGKKWGTGNTQNHTQIGQMTVDFEASWSSNDGARYLGLYGWAFYKQGSIPTKRENGANETFSNEIEWYIIQDRGGYNPATDNQVCKATPYGEATINGVLYEFRVCDRIGQPKLNGNGNFKQFFSIPKNTTSHRQSGIVDVTAHFNAWHAAGMLMDGPLYEVAMKIESYNCGNEGNSPNGSGSGSVTKNILTIGSTGNFYLSATASPSAGGSVGKDPSANSYAPSTPVQLTPMPQTGWQFSHWDGDASGTADPLTVTMNGDKNITAIFTPTEGNTTNLVRDGNFPGSSLTSNWSLNTGEYYGNSVASASVSGGKAAITVTTATANAWEPQLVQYGIELVQGLEYTLTFKAQASAARDIEVSVQMSEDPYTNYSKKGGEKFALTTSQDTYTLPFKMESPSDPNAQLSFNLGGTAGNMPSVTISDVSLKYGGSTGIISPRSPSASAVTAKSGLRASVMSKAVNVSFTAKDDGTAVIKLYNLKGKLLSTAKLQTAAGRNYSHTFNTGKVPKGSYLIDLHNNSGKVEQARVVITR